MHAHRRPAHRPRAPHRSAPCAHQPHGRPPERLARGALALVLPVLLAACAADQPATPLPNAPEPMAVDAARDELAGLAAAAQDRHLTARYTLRRDGEADRVIMVTSANDGSWRVDVPGAALGGTVDISLAATSAGLFQCALPSPARPEPATCVRVGDPDDTLPHRLDPRVQHPFTDWLSVLTDSRAPLSVSPATPPPGATGSCYSVESTSASLNAPLGVGIYCFERDGTPSAVRIDLGTLTLAGPPAPAPASVALAGPVVDGEPFGTAPPPSPDPSVSASAETS